MSQSTEKRPTCWCCGGFVDRIDGSSDECDCKLGTGWHMGEASVGIPPHEVEVCETHGNSND